MWRVKCKTRQINFVTIQRFSGFSYLFGQKVVIFWICRMAGTQLLAKITSHECCYNLHWDQFEFNITGTLTSPTGKLCSIFFPIHGTEPLFVRLHVIHWNSKRLNRPKYFIHQAKELLILHLFTTFEFNLVNLVLRLKTSAVHFAVVHDVKLWSCLPEKYDNTTVPNVKRLHCFPAAISVYHCPWSSTPWISRLYDCGQLFDE